MAQVSDKSVWSSTPRGAGADKLDQDDMKELESLFAVKPSLKTPTAVGPRNLRFTLNCDRSGR